MPNYKLKKTPRYKLGTVSDEAFKMSSNYFHNSNQSKIMKKLLLSLVLTLIFISCNEKSAVEPIVNVEKGVSARTDYDLPELTITGYRDYSNFAETYNRAYTLYIGNDYHVTSNPYRAFTEEYAGENIDDIPGMKAKVIAFLNQELARLRLPQFNDREMVFLNTLSVPQIFSVYSIMVQTWGIGSLAVRSTFYGEGIDKGYSNAFMHVFMSNRMVKELGDNLGTQFVNLHEANETGIATQMDAKNNLIGINLAKANNMVVYSTLYFMALNGQLWIINPNTGVLGQYKFVPKTKLESYQD
jgi:hypothetical protein